MEVLMKEAEQWHMIWNDKDGNETNGPTGKIKVALSFD